MLEVNENKDNVEVVGWYRLDDRNLGRIQRQAEREGGELLILTPRGAAASLSTLPRNLSSAGKDSKKIIPNKRKMRKKLYLRNRRSSVCLMKKSQRLASPIIR